MRILSRLRQPVSKAGETQPHDVSGSEIICISYRLASLAHPFALSSLLEHSNRTTLYAAAVNGTPIPWSALASLQT